MSFLLLFLLLRLSCGQDLRADPAPIIYPGQVNIGLLANIHGPPGNGSEGCGHLRPEAVQRAMAAVWAAHQANFRKDDPQELNIGVYIFDTCGREDVAERQVYRLLGHVGHVQTTDCSEKRIPPLFAVITEGDTDHLQVPLKLLNAFSVPVISASGPPRPQSHILSTSPSTAALARAAVSMLRQLRLVDVAVLAEDDAPVGLFGDFSRQAHVSGMQAVQLENNDQPDDDDDFLNTLTLLSQYGKSRLKAVVFLVGPEQAVQLLASVDDTRLPQIPWVVVTPSDVTRQLNTTFSRDQLRRLQKVLVLSPESTDMPEFEEYFRQLLDEDTVKYHPLLIEFLQFVAENRAAENGSTTAPPTTFPPSDVSATVRAVWTLSTALKSVQRRSCRRGTDCLLYLRRSLSGYVARAASTLDQVVGAPGDGGSTRLKFKEDGELGTVRYGMKGFSEEGDIVQVGFYSDEEGLNVDHDVLMPFSEFVFVEPMTSPSTSLPDTLDPQAIVNSHVSAYNVTDDVMLMDAKNRPEYVEWRIFGDSNAKKTKEPFPATTTDLPSDLDLVMKLHDDVDLQTMSNASDSGQGVVRGPSYSRDDPDTAASTNLRSISMSSHQEPKSNDAYGTGLGSRSDRRVDIPPEAQSPSPSEDIKVERSSSRHVSAWLGRPWALSVLGVCGFLILATLYILVFLMVKACEGTLKKTNCCLAGVQLVSLLSMYFAAGLYTWKPSPLLCGLQRLMPNLSLAFCYGCLLLKGMHLRAQNSLGLGGHISRCNQLLTLMFMVGVQVALEAQWWLLRPPALSSGLFECLTNKLEILESQAYVAFLLLMATAVAVSTRRIPYNQPESRSLIATTLSCLVIFMAWVVACWLLPHSNSRNIAAPSALLATALSVLLGVFGPQLFAIHKYGGFPHKPLSYADSLSTVFTMFKDLDNISSAAGTTSRGKKTAKTLETPFAEMGETTRNPLYSDYQSAYP